jgi:hypothetical protein
MSDAKKVFKWWWPWQTEKMEAMLESMAAEGWALKRVGGALVSYLFEKSEPARIRYCFDYQEKIKPDYLVLLSDAGWKLEHRSSGWYIWSQAYAGERPELYTDIDSLIHRSNAILWTLSSVAAFQIPVMIACLNNTDNPTAFTFATYIIWGLFVGVLAGMTIGAALDVRSLLRRKRTIK